MNTIAIALSDERLLKLQKLANDLNVSIEELVLIGIENLLAQPESLSPTRWIGWRQVRSCRSNSQMSGKLGKSDSTFGK
jgi:hypothetical protein